MFAAISAIFLAHVTLRFICAVSKLVPVLPTPKTQVSCRGCGRVLLCAHIHNTYSIAYNLRLSWMVHIIQLILIFPFSRRAVASLIVTVILADFVPPWAGLSLL